MFANSAVDSPRPICLSIVDRNKICFSRNELVTGILVPRKILTAGSTEFLTFSSNVFYMKCIIRRNW